VLQYASTAIATSNVTTLFRDVQFRP